MKNDFFKVRNPEEVKDESVIFIKDDSQIVPLLHNFDQFIGEAVVFFKNGELKCELMTDFLPESDIENFFYVGSSVRVKEFEEKNGVREIKSCEIISVSLFPKTNIENRVTYDND